MTQRIKNLIKWLPLLFLDPVKYERLRYWFAHKQPLNLDEPVTFNEKLCHRKLFDNNPLYVKIADKVAARGYVQAIAGSEILPELYFAGPPEEIKLDSLPNQFVAKANNASGAEYMEVVKNKEDWSEKSFFQKMHKFVSNRYGMTTNEWWYQQIKPKIIIEEYLQDKVFSAPLDYKLYVFHGCAKIIQVNGYDHSGKYRSFYDSSWKSLPIRKKDVPNKDIFYKPRQLNQIINVAEMLGDAFDYVRVDLYNVNDVRIIFSELTLAPGAGYSPFYPQKWDVKLGTLWQYPK